MTEDEEQDELGGLLDSARAGSLEPSEFAARLEALHARFVGDAASAPGLVARRRDALAAYERLLAAKDMDRHHHLEMLADALGVDVPGGS